MIRTSGQALDEGRTALDVEARLYPENTSYRDVEWSVVTVGGIPSNIAVIEANGSGARITALGDGDFRVRCTSRNGTEKTTLISELEFSAAGLGTAYKDPYGFISAGLYDDHKGEVTSGNERGVATSGMEKPRLVFETLTSVPMARTPLCCRFLRCRVNPMAFKFGKACRRKKEASCSRM